MVKQSTTDKQDETPQTPPAGEQHANARTATERGEVVPFEHFQAFEQPEPVTFAKSYRYVGPGIIPGVPAQDLDAVSVERMPADFRREVAGSPFYEATTEGGK